MRRHFLFFCLMFAAAGFCRAQVSITKTPTGWELSNRDLQVELVRSATEVQWKSLRRNGGTEWAAPNSALAAFPAKSGDPLKYVDDAISDMPKEGKELTLNFQSASGGLFAVSLRLHPTGAILEFVARVENHGDHTISLNSRIDPLLVTLKSPAGGLKPYSSRERQHGFYPVAASTAAKDFGDWFVLENTAAGESVLVGGEPGLGVLHWKGIVHAAATGSQVSAGTLLLKERKAGPAPTFELDPGTAVETPMSFLALAKGDSDDAGNATFRYLKRYVFQTPLPNSPLATYCIWLTERNSEAALLKELEFAKQVGFDVFYHDATWFKDASIVPGVNDWSKGLGSYEEDREKFPHGLKSFSDAVHGAGMKFGLWVDPSNVDANRVETGEIPSDWLAMIDGKAQGTTHPSLALTKQICLGDPKVVRWIEQQLGDIIEKWHLDWIKWDPSATVSYECNRTDHGHGKSDGAYAAYRGRMEIQRYLLERFPNLSGFECDPSLYYARTNPGPQGLLPGGYTNEFITGPMVSPNVWASLAVGGKGDAGTDQLTGRWYSVSALDYILRKHFTHGVTFGNINGMSAQFLSAAPPGYIESFKRNLLFFKQYRHLLLEDVYHPKVAAAGWSSIQYVKEDGGESVVFVFRDKSEVGSTTVKLRGLDANAKYRVSSLNDRPGRDRIIAGAALAQGISERLPDPWLLHGDGAHNPEFADQERYGSDILLLQREP